MYDLDELMEVDDDFEMDDLDELDDDELDDDEEFEVKQAKKVIKVIRAAAPKAVAAVKAGIPPKVAAKKAIKAAVKKQILKKELFDDEVDFDDEFEYDDDTELAMELVSMDDDEEMEHFFGDIIGGAKALLGSPIGKSVLGHVARMGRRLAGRLLGRGRRRRGRRHYRRRPHSRYHRPRYHRRRAICIRRGRRWVPIRYI
jgi:hypothetical protein